MQNNKYRIQGYPMTPKVKVGSIWMTSNMLYFKVTKVENRNGDVWVTYQRKDSLDKTYSCLEPAFIHRFTEFTNR